jgi:hypothetical protein
MANIKKHKDKKELMKKSANKEKAQKIETYSCECYRPVIPVESCSCVNPCMCC